MSTSLQAVEAEAMKLSASDRAELAERLIASIDIPVSLYPEWGAPPPGGTQVQEHGPQA